MPSVPLLPFLPFLPLLPVSPFGPVGPRLYLYLYLLRRYLRELEHEDELEHDLELQDVELELHEDDEELQELELELDDDDEDELELELDDEELVSDGCFLERLFEFNSLRIGRVCFLAAFLTDIATSANFAKSFNGGNFDALLICATSLTPAKFAKPSKFVTTAKSAMLFMFLSVLRLELRCELFWNPSPPQWRPWCLCLEPRPPRS